MNTPTETMPNVVLETRRLVLRAFTSADADDVHRAASDPVVQRWLPLPAPGEPYTRAEAQRWCTEGAAHARASGDGQVWAAVRRDSGRFVGSFALTRTMWRARTTELGYWVAPWAQGDGLASESTVAVSRWALDQGFQRVELKAATGNTASRRVAEKAGFTHEGTERNAMPLHQGRTDLAVYGLIPADLE
ncbi:RimJ/RimL family protein N-acetyltransferase [Haloactinospora alba]|uniref:RimJ/RimL family protein N-acetyltransferase n=1 Tax=Haloactinospora alba TaxID=405555 RepID=A0A543NKV0_9ACTN|nr:GNAT family N-acetyltransferase [Haloactinospora alba]TQN32417.1 RimJ/RimL family protein N-acetyltransferase [Haloactinospora alba]